MASKKRGGKKIGNIRGLSIQFIPFSEIRNLNSDERIRKILDIVLGNNIIILQGKLRPEEESRLIGDTMAMIGHVQDFKGIELAVIAENGEGIMNRLRTNLVNIITRGDTGAITIIGPASIVREIKRDPKKIELFLNK
ncbi:MAG: OapB/ArvB family protein [Minisyncoccales bacterium]